MSWVFHLNALLFLVGVSNITGFYRQRRFINYGSDDEYDYSSNVGRGISFTFPGNVAFQDGADQVHEKVIKIRSSDTVFDHNEKSRNREHNLKSERHHDPTKARENLVKNDINLVLPKVMKESKNVGLAKVIENKDFNGRKKVTSDGRQSASKYYSGSAILGALGSNGHKIYDGYVRVNRASGNKEIKKAVACTHRRVRGLPNRSNSKAKGRKMGRYINIKRISNIYNTNNEESSFLTAISSILSGNGGYIGLKELEAEDKNVADKQTRYLKSVSISARGVEDDSNVFKADNGLGGAIFGGLYGSSRDFIGDLGEFRTNIKSHSRGIYDYDDTGDLYSK